MAHKGVTTNIHAARDGNVTMEDRWGRKLREEAEGVNKYADA
jgi:hypothetical protein